MNMENITVVTFEGIDRWNRPVFKAIDKSAYYGSVDIIFDDDATEAEVLTKITEDNILYLYNDPEDDPMGTKPNNKIVIQRNIDEYDHDATYSPDDNKIRIYPAYRLDKVDYLALKKAGYKWAPKQGLFVTPMWTPERESIALFYCGEIGDEDTTLVDRAEERAGRFEGYSVKRASDAQNAHAGVSAITDNIPLGQPILVGHHSEKRARKDAEKIESGMRRAVKLWDTSEYWTRRAAGALHHAKYKERPDVRARRIKKIEADKRRIEVRFTPNPKQKPLMMKGWNDETELLHVWCGKGRGGQWVKESSLEAIKKRSLRWIAHYENRLAYEKAMLEEQGASQLLEKKKRPKQLPLCNYKAPEGININNIYHRGQVDHHEQVEMTKAEFKKIYSDYKGTRVVDNSHRVRIAMQPGKGYRTVAVYLTDSKTHKRPEAIEKSPVAPTFSTSIPVEKKEPTEKEKLEETLKNGIEVVAVEQLFETPELLADRVVEEADIKTGETVLDPEAGPGALLDAIRRAEIGVVNTAIEINSQLCDRLKLKGYDAVYNVDFLDCTVEEYGLHNKIIMNPPYKNSIDVKHVKHALTFLAPGGRLVAICADGPRQQEALRPLAEKSGGFWEKLPAGTFQESGTMVNTALMVIEG
jgi:Domain of unknown function (DUF3560)